jgi:hypothetical protein
MRSVAPPSIATGDIYWGAVPFIILQLIVLALVWAQPGIVTTIPAAWNRNADHAAHMRRTAHALPAAPPDGALPGEWR